MNFNPNNKEEEIKQYNQEIENIKREYNDFHNKLNEYWEEYNAGKFPELYKRMSRAKRNLVDKFELQLLQTSDEPDTNETARSNWNKTIKKRNDGVIELHKEAVAAMKAWVEKVEEAKENELKKTAEEPEKQKDEPNAELNKYNYEVEAHEKEYEEWRSKLLKDIIFYKYGKRDGDTNEVLVSPPDRAGFEEIEELMKKVEPLKHIFPNTPDKNARYREFNQRQLKVREEIIAKMRTFLDKNSKSAEEADKKAEEILNNKSRNQENKDNQLSNTLSQLNKLRDEACRELNKLLSDNHSAVSINFDYVEKIYEAESKEEIDKIKEQVYFELKKEKKKERSERGLNEILFLSRIWEGSAEELKQHVKQLEVFNGTASYQEKVDFVTVHKKAIFSRLGAPNYAEIIIEIINNRLSQFSFKPEELGTEIQKKLINLTSETNFDKINELETEINQKINELEATKKLERLQNKVKNCRSLYEREGIEEEINDFIASDKVYYQQKAEEAKRMLRELKVNTSSQPQSPNNFPWKIVTPIALLSVVLVAGIILVKRRKIKREK